MDSGIFRDGIIHPQLENALDFVTRWSHRWRLQFNPNKYEAICFHNAKVQLKTTFQAKISDGLIPYVSELKCLGLYYDEHLSWNRHIRESASRALTRLNKLRKAV